MNEFGCKLGNDRQRNRNGWNIDLSVLLLLLLVPVWWVRVCLIRTWLPYFRAAYSWEPNVETIWDKTLAKMIECVGLSSIVLCDLTWVVVYTCIYTCTLYFLVLPILVEVHTTTKYNHSNQGWRLLVLEWNAFGQKQFMLDRGGTGGLDEIYGNHTLEVSEAEQCARNCEGLLSRWWEHWPPDKADPEISSHSKIPRVRIHTTRY